MRRNIRGNVPVNIGEEVPLFLSPAPEPTSGRDTAGSGLYETVSSYSDTQAYRYNPQNLGGTDILIGTHKGNLRTEARVYWDDQAVRLHKNRRWMLDCLRYRHPGLPLEAPGHSAAPGTELTVPDAFLAPEPEKRPGRHVLSVGMIGSGKSTFLMKMLREQLRLGCSALVLDIKEETLQQALHSALEAGIPKEDIIAIVPSADNAVPGWNPFLVETRDIRTAARAFRDIVEASSPSSIPRAKEILKRAAVVMAAQGLSVVELNEFLTVPAYRNRILEIARETGTWDLFRQEHAFFVTQYAAMSAGSQQEAAQASMGKVSDLVENPYLAALMSARENTLDLATFWQRQRLLLVLLDDETKILAGVLAHTLYRTAMKKSGPVPVVLCLDELADQQRFLGKSVEQILNVGRGKNLRVLAACQFLGQLKDDLYDAFLTNAPVKAFFRLGDQDVAKAASIIVGGSGGQPERITLTADKELERYVYAVTDGDGNRIGIPDKAAWEKIRRASDPLLELRALGLRWARPAMKVGSETLWDFLRGVPKEAWRLVGPPEKPLHVAVTFPRPRVRVEERSESALAGEMAMRLKQMPPHHAMVRIGDMPWAYVAVADTPFPPLHALPSIEEYASGMTAEEAARADNERSRRIEELSAEAGTPAPKKPVKPAKPIPVNQETDHGDDDSI